MVHVLRLFNSLQKHCCAHVLLYHATYSRIPDNLKERLHNVHPDALGRQISWLKKHFDLVEVDQLFSPDVDIAGKAAITFDDAYLSVFDEAIPVMESLDAPCTIFVNGTTLSGRPLWRDKIRFLINNGLVGEFLEFHASCPEVIGLTIERFYKQTKSPERNSRNIDQMCDAFLDNRGIDLSDIVYCVDDSAKLISHPLVSYGNHTFSHYVLSSLSDREQEEEIAGNGELLSKHCARLSRVFSVPFGGQKHFNDATVNLLKKHGYVGFLYSRNALNISRAGRNQVHGDCMFRERYMVPPDWNSFHKSLARMFIRGLLRSVF